MPGFVTKSKGRHQFGSIKVGKGDADLAFLRDIIAGTVTLPATGTIALTANGGTASASAAVQGLSTSHNVVLSANLLVEAASIGAAIAIANGIQVTAVNSTTANVSASAQAYSYLAFRTDG